MGGPSEDFEIEDLTVICIFRNFISEIHRSLLKIECVLPQLIGNNPNHLQLPQRLE